MLSDQTIKHALTQDAVNLLTYELRQNESAPDFLHAADQIVSNPKNRIPLPEALELPEQLAPGQKNDASNAILLYEALGEMSPANAADPRLWTYLTFVSLREYMEDRWNPMDQSNMESYVRDHWLMNSQSARIRVRNGAARLWWVAHLTVDNEFKYELSQELNDPYAYTKWVFGNENRRQSLFERNIGRSPVIRWAAMETLAKDTSTDVSNVTKRFFRRLNLQAGFQRLEKLPDVEVKALMERTLEDSVIK